MHTGDLAVICSQGYCSIVGCACLPACLAGVGWLICRNALVSSPTTPLLLPACGHSRYSCTLWRSGPTHQSMCTTSVCLLFCLAVLLFSADCVLPACRRSKDMVIRGGENVYPVRRAGGQEGRRAIGQGGRRGHQRTAARAPCLRVAANTLTAALPLAPAAGGGGVLASPPGSGRRAGKPAANICVLSWLGEVEAEAGIALICAEAGS